jgi:hypothetical protein
MALPLTPSLSPAGRGENEGAYCQKLNAFVLGTKKFENRGNLESQAHDIRKSVHVSTGEGTWHPKG